MDAFFASVEQLLIPALRGRPVIVGGGVIASCSYEARACGLKAGMPLFEARRLCPRAVILEGSQHVYRCFAEAVWTVCRRYTVGLETYLDEAYADASGMERIHGAPDELGRKLQRQVLEEVGLPVSIGLARNRMLAKIASAAAKPRGVAWIAPEDEDRFLAPMPVEKLLGVGRKTARKLRDMNIRTVGELRAVPRATLRQLFGKNGEVLHDRCRGEDLRATRPDRPPRTISRETTFHQATGADDEIRGTLFYLTERAMRAVRDKGMLARRVELTIRYADWKQHTAGRTLSEPAGNDDEAFAEVERLLERLHTRRVRLRHVGIVLSQFVRKGDVGRLLEPAEHKRRRELYAATDAIRGRYGHGAVISGKSIELLGRMDRNDYGFILRTPSLTK